MTNIIQIGSSVDPKITQIGNVIKLSFRSEIRWTLSKLQISFRSEIRWTPKITQIGNVAKITFRSEIRWTPIEDNIYHSDRKFGGPQDNPNRECKKNTIQIGN